MHSNARTRYDGAAHLVLFVSQMTCTVSLCLIYVFQLEAMVPRIHLLYPLTLVRGFWDDMMSQAHSFITSTWTFYLQADDGKVVIFQVCSSWEISCLVLCCKSVAKAITHTFSCHKTEPQVRFFSHFDLGRDEDEEEDAQKNGKPTSACQLW